mgnify:CR=1 FL=1
MVEEFFRSRFKNTVDDEEDLDQFLPVCAHAKILVVMDRSGLDDNHNNPNNEETSSYTHQEAMRHKRRLIEIFRRVACANHLLTNSLMCLIEGGLEGIKVENGSLVGRYMIVLRESDGHVILITKWLPFSCLCQENSKNESKIVVCHLFSLAELDLYDCNSNISRRFASECVGRNDYVIDRVQAGERAKRASLDEDENTSHY